MQLCFSNLASWPLFLVAVALYFDPTRYSWSLQKVLESNQLQAFFLLDGRNSNMILFFFIFYFIQWVLRAEITLISLVLYFLLKSDIHVHLAVASVLGILFSTGCYHWWMHKDLKSESFKIWKSFSMLQIMGIFVSAVLSLYLLHFVSVAGYFSGTYSSNRFQFLLLVVAINYFLPLALSILWGHFYFKPKVKEPTDFPIHYSTANWILRFKIRPYFRKKLADQTLKYLSLHQTNLADLESLKDLGPASIPNRILLIIKTELGYLRLASSRLTIE